MSRLIGDADSSMPARYAYNNDKGSLYISSFSKSSDPLTYEQTNCSIANTTAAKSACTGSSGQRHRVEPTGPIGNKSGLNTYTINSTTDVWENW